MAVLGGICHERKECEQALRWYTQGAEAGVPNATYNLGYCLDRGGVGVAAPDYPAAADWYKRAADAGFGQAANNLSYVYTVGRGRASQMCLLHLSSVLELGGNT
jgi:TPR repeat protein